MKRSCLFVLAVIMLLSAGCSVREEMEWKPELPTEVPVPAPDVPAADVPVPADTVPADTAEEPTEEAYLPTLEDPGDWSATASSVESEAFAAGFAVDGDIETRWSTEWADNQWLLIDFQREEVLESIKLYWEDAYARDYRILLSTDQVNWVTVADETQGHSGEKTFTFDRQPARWVKVEAGRRGTQWGFSIVEMIFNPGPEATLRAKTTASSGSGDYAAKYAVDGDMSTRWSSDFGDHEWWQIEFDGPTMVAGVKIAWETAFSEKYSIRVSDDGKTWKTVYDVPESDGRTDLLFFKPVKANFLRIACRQRGTGWGNSIHEIEFFDESKRLQAVASSALEAHGADRAVDGDRETYWHSEGSGEEAFSLELPKVMNLGGLELGWGDDFARAYTVDISKDGAEWRTVSEIKLGNGGYDYVFFPAVDAKMVRIRCLESATGNGYAIKHVEFKGGEEQATPIREYKAAAKDSPRGYYPWWLLREQEFWNVVGGIDDWHESLIGESGTIEPYKNGFSVMPFILDGEDLVTWADVQLEQRLDKDMLPLPTATWNSEAWKLDISAVAFGPLDKSSTAVRYRLINEGREPFRGRLALAIRPVQLNPAWQHGGMSPIHNVKCFLKDHGSYLEVNGRPALVSVTKPVAMGAAPLGAGDVIDYIARGTLPDTQEASQSEGMTSAGMLYELEVPAGESRDVIVAFLLHDSSKLSEEFIMSPEEGFESIWAEKADEWWNLLNRFSIKIPEQRLINIMKSNLAYILINKDGPWIKPGSRNYAHAWIRDGAMTSVSLLRMGLYEMVKKYIEAYTPLINEHGWCPYIILEGGNPVAFNGNPNSGEGQEFDSQGQYLFLVRQYYDYTEDREFLEEVYPTVQRVLRFSKRLREARMTDEYRNDPEKKAYYGILPHSNSHEGYFPAKHSYWDDFWMLAGLKDAAYLAGQLGREEDVKWIREEEEDLRKNLLASIMMVIKRDNLDHIPGCVELGDFDATSTAIAIMACGEKDHLPEPYKTRTFERYFEDFEKGTRPGHERTFTPYEVRTADAFVRLGDRDKGLAMLRYFTEDSVRPYGWNHFAEVVHARPRAPSYIGDMPHTWVGSGYMNAIRSIFVYEYEGRLVLAAGIDPAWAARGGVEVETLPTQYGSLSYTVMADGDVITIDIQAGVNPPNGIEVHLPKAWRGKSTELNGQSVEAQNGVVTIASAPATITLQ